jgi:uncharacterized membrane protein YphA (DoxX/SURF4 family)
VRRLFAAAASLPIVAGAHERWVKHELHAPIDKEFFRHMSGDVLRWSLLATLVIAGIIAAWYLVAVPLCDKITPHTAEDEAAYRRRPLPVRIFLTTLRYFLDGEIESPLLEKLERAAAFFFAKIPAAVLALGVYQHWIIMPSYPLTGRLGEVLRVAEAILAVWVVWGRGLRALGVVLFLIYIYLCVGYGIAAVDAIPVLASAFFYFYATPGSNEVNSRQLAGIRVSLGAGFFLLGMINKMYIAELFIGVGDNYPQLIDGMRHIVPNLTRESWSFITALGEMTFGLLLLIGVFDKLTCIALSLIFSNFILTFGPAEIVHIYPIAGFLILLFHAPPGTVLDGAVFRTHVGLWRLAGHRSSPTVFALALALVAVSSATLLMFTPLFTLIHVVPRI